MTEDVIKQLSDETMTPFHNRVLTHCRDLINMSRAQMSRYYDRWDRHDMAYRGERVQDIEDVRAVEKGDTAKLAVPLTYAQIQTAVAFFFSVYFQRKTFFELTGVAQEDHVAAKVAEAILERDLRYNKFSSALYESLLDCFKFGFMAFQVGWIKETTTVWKERTEMVPPLMLGPVVLRKGSSETTQEAVQATKYLGNSVKSISPYRIFPDTRLPLTRFQEGEFCGSEDEYTFTYLKELESRGEVAGVDHIRGLKENEPYNAVNSRFSNVDFKTNTSLVQGLQRGSIIVTQCQLNCVPSKFMIDGEPLGKEDYPMKYNIWYANNHRVIKFEPLGYLHNEFTYCLGQMSPDKHRLLNEGIADMCTGLQDVVNWFLNSHITNVRKVLSNFLIVDPAGVDIADLKARKPVIKLKPGVSRQGVDKWIKQLEIRDVTSNHIKDIDSLQSLMMMITGINENIMGQFHGGRRSASEARAVNAGTANRLLMTAKVLWTDCFEPMGRQMLSNSRDGMDEPAYVRVAGEVPNLMAYKQFVQADKSKLAGEYDFEVFDGTLPSEKANTAEALNQILQAMLANPQAASVLGFDPQKIMLELAYLQDVPNPERFLLPQAQQTLALQGLVPPGWLESPEGAAIVQLIRQQLMQQMQTQQQGQTPGGMPPSQPGAMPLPNVNGQNQPIPGNSGPASGGISPGQGPDVSGGAGQSIAGLIT